MIQLHIMDGITGDSIWPWMDPIAAFNGDAPAGGWPRISIVTPNFNYGNLIETTLRSVLMQQYPNLEYIVIDDGSTDNSLDVIRKYEPKLAYFEQHANCGQYATINKGFSKASGDICGWINSDDIFLPWTLRAVGRIFAQFPELQWITGHPSAIQDGVPHRVSSFRVYPREMIKAGCFYFGPGGEGPIQQESTFWRRGLWEKVGGLRPEVKFAADYELWLRFARHAELYATSTLLTGFTIRGNQNRSIKNADRYNNEVYACRDATLKDPEVKREKVVRDLAMYRKARRVMGLKRLARGMISQKYKGPLLEWDFAASQYKLKWQEYFT